MGFRIQLEEERARGRGTGRALFFASFSRKGTAAASRPKEGHRDREGKREKGRARKGGKG